MNLFYTLFENVYSQSASSKKARSTNVRVQKQQLQSQVADIRRTLQSFLDPNSASMQIYNDPNFKTLKSKYENLYELDEMKQFVDKITQNRQTPQSVLKYIVDYMTNFIVKGQKSRTIENKIIQITERNFREMFKQQAKDSSFEGSGYLDDFKKFFPSKISFDLSPSRDVINFIEVYGNKSLDIQEKSERIAFIRKNYDSIVKKVTKDMKSSNVEKKTISTILGVIMSTGIRPGTKLGSAYKKDKEGKYIIADDESKEKLKIDTYGAVNLRPDHVKSINDDYVKLEFPGKKGTINTAEIHNDSEFHNEIIKSINKLYEKNKDTDSLFSRLDCCTYSQLQKYCKDLGNFNPSDFRKEVATKEFYYTLREQAKQIHSKYKEMKNIETENLKQQIANNITEALTESARKVQQKLSHEDWGISIEQYIDPKIIINFLNNAHLEDEFDDIIINNKNVRLNFDVDEFVNYVQGT
jgi:hypothetical protein